MVSAGTGFRGGNCKDCFCAPALRFSAGFLLLSEIFADDLAIELVRMWPFEQQPEFGFKSFTNRWQFGQDNGLPSCECRVDGPQNRPVQRHHQHFVRAACPLRHDRMLEVSETIDQMSSHERSYRQPDFRRPRAKSFGIEIVKIHRHPQRNSGRPHLTRHDERCTHDCRSRWLAGDFLHRPCFAATPRHIACAPGGSVQPGPSSSLL